MKYSAKSPYPSAEQWLGVYILPVAAATTLVTAFFVAVEVLSTLDVRLLLFSQICCMLGSIAGAVLIALAKMSNLRRGIWFSFGASSLEVSYRNSYLIGRALLITCCASFLLIRLAIVA